MNEGKKAKTEQPDNRNWVAKNAIATTKSAAGYQKDRKKADKRGETKYKEKYTESNEYSDEVGMVKSNLHTIIRMCKELDDHMISDENLPEWVEEKVSQAKAMIVSAGDYIISQHEMGNIQKTDEGWKDVAKGAGRGLAAAAIIGGASGIGSHLDKTHPSQFKSNNTRYTISHNPQDAQGRDAQKTMLNGKPYLVWHWKGQDFAYALPVKEGFWTHDTLADQLFEHERTYEEVLENKLNKQLKKYS